jgi:hypothetical protein
MYYAEFIKSFAAYLGKIGHTIRARAGEQRDFLDKMGLVERPMTANPVLACP